MNTVETKNSRPSWRQRLVFLTVVAAFVAPIGIAWLASAGWVDFGSSVRTNRGTLINPPVDLRSSDPAEVLFEKANLGPGEWVVLYLPNTACEAQCAEILQRLTTIRSLLGYSGQRVRILGLASAVPSNTLPPEIAARVITSAEATQELRTLLANRLPTDPAGHIVLIDWRRQLVLGFDGLAPQIDVKKDLKRLLRGSKVR